MHNKTLLGALVLGILAPCLDAQRQRLSQEDLISRKEQMLGEAFLKNADWILSFAEARKQAKAKGKLIFAYFTRSYSP